MKPVKRMSMKDVVVDKLHKHIVDHKLQPGDRFLNEKEIIQLTGVSRTVVREALKALEAVGVLRIKPGDGVFVSESSMDHLISQYAFRWSKDQSRMLELLETRIMLELAAIELVIKRLGAQPGADNEIAQLDVQMERMATAIRLGRPIIEEDVAFHRTLFRLTGNQTFYELSEIITQYFDEVRRSRMAEASGYGNTLTEHAELVRLIRGREIESAKKTMTRHLNPLREIILDGNY